MNANCRRLCIGFGAVLAAVGFSASPAAADTPPNNKFSAATEFCVAPCQMNGSNEDATRQPGEPNNGHMTVWWKWTAPAAGRYRLDTCSTPDFSEGVVAVYTGRSVASSFAELTEVANSLVTDETEHWCLKPFSTAAVFFDAQNGFTYYFSVGIEVCCADWSDRLRVSLRRTPRNDMFASASTIRRTPATVGGENSEATRELGEPPNGFATLWWKWRAPDSRFYRIDTCQSPALDSVIAIHSGTAVHRLVGHVKSGRTGAYLCRRARPRGGKQLFFRPVARRTYYISVAGRREPFWNRSHDIRLSVVSTVCANARSLVQSALDDVRDARRALSRAAPRARARAVRRLAQAQQVLRTARARASRECKPA